MCSSCYVREEKLWKEISQLHDVHVEKTSFNRLDILCTKKRREVPLPNKHISISPPAHSTWWNNWWSRIRRRGLINLQEKCLLHMTHQRAASYGRERKTNKFSAGSDGGGGAKTTICSEVFKVCNVFIISIITRVGVPIDLSARNSHAFYCYFPLCITFAALAFHARALPHVFRAPRKIWKQITCDKRKNYRIQTVLMESFLHQIAAECVRSRGRICVNLRRWAYFEIFANFSPPLCVDWIFAIINISQHFSLPSCWSTLSVQTKTL